MLGYPIQSAAVMPLSTVSIQGNVTPLAWYKTIKRTKDVDGGRKTDPKPDLVAILILADIVYWYRPILERDEETGDVIGYRQKFAADKLQRNYKAYINMYGLGEYQVKDAFDTLEQIGVISLEFRQINRDGKSPLQNVMFIELNVEKLIEITFPSDMRFKPTRGGRFKPPTYTENTNNNDSINANSKNAGNSGEFPALDNSNNSINSENLPSSHKELVNATHLPRRAPALSGREPVNIVEEIESAAQNCQTAFLNPPERSPVIQDASCGASVTGTEPAPAKKRGRPRKNPELSKTDLYPMASFRHDVRPLLQVFCDKTGIKPFVKDAGLWHQQANVWKKLEVTAEMVAKAIDKAQKSNMVIKSPKSIEYLLINPTALTETKSGITLEDLEQSGFRLVRQPANG